jgi:hypothetical protein
LSSRYSARWRSKAGSSGKTAFMRQVYASYVYTQIASMTPTTTGRVACRRLLPCCAYRTYANVTIARNHPKGCPHTDSMVTVRFGQVGGVSCQTRLLPRWAVPDGAGAGRPGCGH